MGLPGRERRWYLQRLDNTIHERDRRTNGQTDGPTDRHPAIAKTALTHCVAL